MDTGDIEEAQKLLEKGYQHNPDRWEFSFYLGWIQWMYRGNTSKTYDYLMESVMKKNCPPYVTDMLKGFTNLLKEREPDRMEMTQQYIKSILRSTDDPYTLLDRVTTIFPHTLFFYLYGSLFLVFELNDIDEAQYLLQEGYETHPENWELPFYLGWIHWIYRRDVRTTYYYLSQTIQKDNCPKHVHELHTGFHPDKMNIRSEHAIFYTRYLDCMILYSKDPEMKEHLVKLKLLVSDQ
jgi:tetratricopeptide (TPR) repeat protein